VVLSLVIGLWYQTLEPKEGRDDPSGTAWIIATYIITAGACECFPAFVFGEKDKLISI